MREAIRGCPSCCWLLWLAGRGTDDPSESDQNPPLDMSDSETGTLTHRFDTACGHLLYHPEEARGITQNSQQLAWHGQRHSESEGGDVTVT